MNRKAIYLMMKPKYDFHASQFITNHQLATGVVMSNIQRQAVNNLYLRYKGLIPNPNGSNLWSLYQARATKPRVFINAPSDNTTASSAGFGIEFLTQSSLGSFSGPWVSGDFTPTGAMGGTGKCFNAGIAPSAYPQNDFCYGYYNRSPITSTSFEAGCNDGSNYNSISILRVGGTSSFYRNNEVSASGSITGITTSQTLGSILCSRSSSSNEYLYNGATLLDSRTSTSSPGGSQNMYFHALNNGGALLGESNRQLAGYDMGLPHLTANQLSDRNWMHQLYHTEVITGGRQV